jgi:hypothetical protein
MMTSKTFADGTTRLAPRFTSMELCLADDDRCLTITPHVKDLNFTLRGCAQQTLPYPLKTDSRLNQTGCFLVKSRAGYSAQQPIVYTVCVCKEKNCNRFAQSSKLLMENAEEDMNGQDIVASKYADGEHDEHDPSQPSPFHKVARDVTQSASVIRQFSLHFSLFSIIYFYFT